jgi:hypothetical protein
MRRTYRWTLCAVFLCFAANLFAQAQKLMTDPLFGISYDRRRVPFERMPAVLIESCPRLHGRYVAAWVYGHLKTTDSEYFLISGLMKSQADEPGGARTVAPDEAGGVVVALRGSECLVDQAEYFLMQGNNPGKTATPIMVSASVLNGILQDSFKRYVVAFGGKQEFLKHVKPNAPLPVVREQLQTFEKNPDE